MKDNNKQWAMTEEQKREIVASELFQGVASGETYCDVCNECVPWGDGIDVTFTGEHDANGDPVAKVTCESCFTGTERTITVTLISERYDLHGNLKPGVVDDEDLPF